VIYWCSGVCQPELRVHVSGCGFCVRSARMLKSWCLRSTMDICIALFCGRCGCVPPSQMSLRTPHNLHFVDANDVSCTQSTKRLGTSIMYSDVLRWKLGWSSFTKPFPFVDNIPFYPTFSKGRMSWVLSAARWFKLFLEKELFYLFFI